MKLHHLIALGVVGVGALFLASSVVAEQRVIQPKHDTAKSIVSNLKLGTIQNIQIGELNSFTEVEGKMFGAGKNTVVIIDDNGQIERTIPTTIQSPTISAFKPGVMIIGDCGKNILYTLDINTEKVTELLRLSNIRERASAQFPGAELLSDRPLGCVASDGNAVFVAVKAGFSSAIFKIDPSSQRILERGFATSPDPSAMLFQKGNLFVLDGKSRQLRRFSSNIKPSKTWTEVPVSDGKGLVIRGDEVMILSPVDKSIIKLRMDMSLLVQPAISVTLTTTPVISVPIQVRQFPEKYAVLICGDIAENFWGECFWNDTVWMYKTLLNAGYEPENIYVLYGYGSDYASANPNYQHSTTVTDFPATVNWVNKVFNGMKNGDAANGIKKMRDVDTLFVWTFDHGGGGNPAYLCLWGGAIYDSDFATKLNAIPYAKRAIFMQQCRSGGFIDNLQNNKTMISTACLSTQDAYPANTENESYGGKTYSHGEYNYYIICALSRLNPTGGSVNADENSNGKISAREAHNWESSHENLAEIPQVSDTAGIGLNFHIED